MLQFDTKMSMQHKLNCRVKLGIGCPPNKYHLNRISIGYIAMSSLSNRPPVLEQTCSPATPVADLSEYTPSEKPESGNTIFTPNNQKILTPTSDVSDACSPQSLPIPSEKQSESSMHRSVPIGAPSPRKVQAENQQAGDDYPDWYMFFVGILLGLVFSVFSLTGALLVHTKTRLHFLVGCMIGAFVQGAVGLLTYNYMILKQH